MCRFQTFIQRLIFFSFLWGLTKPRTSSSPVHSPGEGSILWAGRSSSGTNEARSKPRNPSTIAKRQRPWSRAIKKNYHVCHTLYSLKGNGGCYLTVLEGLGCDRAMQISNKKGDPQQTSACSWASILDRARPVQRSRPHSSLYSLLPTPLSQSHVSMPKQSLTCNHGTASVHTARCSVCFASCRSPGQWQTHGFLLSAETASSQPREGRHSVLFHFILYFSSLPASAHLLVAIPLLQQRWQGLLRVQPPANSPGRVWKESRPKATWLICLSISSYHKACGRQSPCPGATTQQ